VLEHGVSSWFLSQAFNQRCNNAAEYLKRGQVSHDLQIERGPVPRYFRGKEVLVTVRGETHSSLVKELCGVLFIKIVLLFLLWWQFFSTEHRPELSGSSVANFLVFESSPVQGIATHGENNR
jgi:hypothetical protein